MVFDGNYNDIFDRIRKNSLDHIDKESLLLGLLHQIATRQDMQINQKLFRELLDSNRELGVILNLQLKHTKKLSETDFLTGAYNRTKLFEYLNEVCKYTGEDLYSVVMFDIDHFKIVNDTYGHDIGDEVLKTLSKITQRHTRSSDIFARFGGEEFIVVVKMNLDRAGKFAERLREKIEETKFNKVSTVTCSFGVSLLQQGDSPESVIKRADIALYESKDTGRNKVTLNHE